MNSKRMCGLVLVLLGSVVTSATAGNDLARKSNCLGCHAVDRKVVGPAFRDVAKKYANQSGAQSVLASNIKKGGQGRWGAVPMPAQEALSETNAQALAAWILAGAK